MVCVPAAVDSCASHVNSITAQHTIRPRTHSPSPLPSSVIVTIKHTSTIRSQNMHVPGSLVAKFARNCAGKHVGLWLKCISPVRAEDESGNCSASTETYLGQNALREFLVARFLVQIAGHTLGNVDCLANLS